MGRSTLSAGVGMLENSSNARSLLHLNTSEIWEYTSEELDLISSLSVLQLIISLCVEATRVDFWSVNFSVVSDWASSGEICSSSVRMKLEELRYTVL